MVAQAMDNHTCTTEQLRALAERLTPANRDYVLGLVCALWGMQGGAGNAKAGAKVTSRSVNVTNGS
jgi:cytochrome c-type biogenesis protein CcmH/NrfG